MSKRLQYITASFVAKVSFGLLAFWELPMVIGAKVSFQRINSFLLEVHPLLRTLPWPNTD